MSGYSTVSSLNKLFANIYEDAVFAVREQTIATRLVTTFTDGRGDQTRTISEYPSVSFQAVAETEDYANPTEFKKTSLSTLTPGEYMAQFILTDRRLETDPQDARRDAAMELGYGAADKVDSDVLGNIANLTGGTVGASGTTMIWGYLFAAISRLRQAKVPRPYYAVLAPYHWHDLATAVTPAATTATNAPQFQDEVMRRWYVGNVAGLDGIFVSANVPVSGTDAYSAVFNPRAIAYDLRRDFRLEPERDASARAYELNATMLYAHGVWRPKWGVAIQADNSAPES